MARALLVVLLCAALAGCVQTAAPPAAVQPPAAAAPTSFPVTCALQDENKTPLASGTCTWQFGTLGATVEVDETGQAVRGVPAGAKGTVKGSAPGRAGAHASLTVDGPKIVRMTLPATLHPRASEAPSAPQANQTAPPPAANQTQEAPAAEPVENATVYYDSVRDLLFEQLYAIVPGDPPGVQQYTFEVAPQYQTLELVGSYVEPYAYAAYPNIKVYGPDGAVVMQYDNIDAKAVATGTGGGMSTPLGFLIGPAPGTYRISIGGAGVPAIEISAYGLIGLAPDFAFTDLPSGTPYHLRDFAGQITVVDLMASWCGPCNEAMPGLKKIRDDYDGKVQILSVDIDQDGDPESDLQAFIQKHNVEWPIGYEIDGSAWSVYGTGWIPTMVLVDQHGGLIYRHIGEVDQQELRDRIDAALAAG